MVENVENRDGLFQCTLVALAYGLPFDRIVNMLRERNVCAPESYVRRVAQEKERLQEMQTVVEWADPEHLADIPLLWDRIEFAFGTEEPEAKRIVEKFLAELGGIR